MLDAGSFPGTGLDLREGMVAEAVPAGIPVADARPRPYRPSWLDLLFDAISALPGPTWLAYLALMLPSVALTNSSLWLSGLQPWGALDPTQVFWGVATVLILAATHYLRVAAAAAFDRFIPALGEAPVDIARERYELTVMPARAVLVITAINVIMTPLYYLLDPVGTATEGLEGLGWLGRFLSEALTGILILAIAYQGVRQLRRVSRLHAVAERVDPFSPAPLYAFARLTGITAAILMAFNALGFAVSPQLFSSSPASLAFGGAWLAGIAVVAGSIFVLPLRGMHARLEAIRDGLDDAAGVRLKALLAELNEAIDARDATRVDAIDRSIGALRREREVLRALPTWPWSTGTIRGVASALALPLVLFLIQRFLGQLLGA
jgi:hypothetical protein